MNILPLIRGECPICKRLIMNETKTEYNEYGMMFWVEFSDGSKAQFSICRDCYPKITQAQLDKIMESQKVNWGQEIQAQLNWYVRDAVNLRIVKHAESKDGLKT